MTVIVMLGVKLCVYLSGMNKVWKKSVIGGTISVVERKRNKVNCSHYFLYGADDL